MCPLFIVLEPLEQHLQVPSLPTPALLSPTSRNDTTSKTKRSEAMKEYYIRDTPESMIAK
jgi:hypothetical protein